MASVTIGSATSRRALLFHDVLAFLALLASSLALFGVTLFLFRSFEEHRVDLGRRWAARGQLALQQGRPNDAVSALRTALAYAPDQQTDQLMLAQALAAAGHTDEANNYFLSLWDSRPGDGLINLQLARLARRRGDVGEAIDYYRASIFGSWEGDGVVRRRAVRLELVDFLIQKHQFGEARNELFTVAGNAPDDARLNLEVAEKMQAAGYPADALAFYEKSLASNIHDRPALEGAGRIAFSEGNYAMAERLLERALKEKPLPGETATLQPELLSLIKHAERMQELTLTRDQPPAQRAQHILVASKIAQQRLSDCEVQAAGLTRYGAQLASLITDWSEAASGHKNLKVLLENAETQDSWSQLIFRTEQETAQACGAPQGDDGLLLDLSQSASGQKQ